MPVLLLAILAAGSGCAPMRVGMEMEEPETALTFEWPKENWSSASGLVTLSRGPLRSSDPVVDVTSSARETIDGKDYLGIRLYGHDEDLILECLACPIETPQRYVDIRLTLDRRLPAKLRVDGPAEISLFNADGDVDLGREAELSEGKYRLMLKPADKQR
jgi:hypothetical protein